MMKTATENTLAQESLPTDVATLQQLVLQQMEVVEQLRQAHDNLLHQIKNMQQKMFGRKSEDFCPEQGLLFDKLSEEAQITPEKETISYTRNKNNKSSTKHHVIPDELPRERVDYDLEDADKTCLDCDCELHRIGKDITEQLEHAPAKLYVKQHARAKYACRSCESKVVTAEGPMLAIPKGIAGPSLLAQTIIAKYQDHLPLHRQEQILARHGVKLARSTMSDWLMSCGQLLAPLVETLRKQLLTQPKIHTDDTRVQVQAPGNGKTNRSYLWVYIGCGGASPPIICYDYTRSRSQKGPMDYLQHYEGYLQADAFPGYDVLFNDGKIKEVACWAHCRRKYYEIITSAPKHDSAQKALHWIQQLYAIEKEAKELSDEERQRLRQEKAKPILNEFKQWLDTQVNCVPPKSPLGQAMSYNLKNWAALTRYLDNGILEIDNNRAERAIKPLVIGRKNYMFFGSDKGGKNAAILYSLIETCKANNVEPLEYLTDILTRLPAHPINQIEQLLPFNWKK